MLVRYMSQLPGFDPGEYPIRERDVGRDWVILTGNENGEAGVAGRRGVAASLGRSIDFTLPRSNSSQSRPCVQKRSRAVNLLKEKEP